jgi:hypothetical protein
MKFLDLLIQKYILTALLRMSSVFFLNLCDTLRDIGKFS